MNQQSTSQDFTRLTAKIKAFGKELGFQDVRITDCDITSEEPMFKRWLANGMHGEMNYLERNIEKRLQPDKLVSGTIRIISVRLNYLPMEASIKNILRDKDKAYISRYAVGRNYHKMIRQKLAQLACKINEQVGHWGYRAFCDSAPVLERAIAKKSGIGWVGKNTMIMHRDAGSWFFLGELYTTLPLPTDAPVKDHCGQCTACIDICPTKAIIAPYKLDARKCISYLTIENKNSIPIEFRKSIGNRIFGCDDCQLICPWNRFAKFTTEPDFKPRHHLLDSQLVDLFNWTEDEFLRKTEGSAIRRAGYAGWIRNIAVALGNAPHNQKIITALNNKKDQTSSMITEHILWALQQQLANRACN